MSTKYELVMHCLNTIYSHAHAAQIQQLEQIFRQQQRLVEGSLGGFWYKAEHYFGQDTGYQKSKSLDPSLHADMQQYLSQKKQLAQESQYIQSYLSAVFNHCPLEQAHHLLPPTLHSILKNRGVAAHPEAPESHPQIFKYNQKGYELLLQRILFNTVGI